MEHTPRHRGMYALARWVSSEPAKKWWVIYVFLWKYSQYR